MKSKDTSEMVPEQDRYRWRTGSPVSTANEAAIWYLKLCQSGSKSTHTIKTYRNSLNQIGKILADLTGHPISALPLEAVNRNDLVDAFDEYSITRAPASQKLAWSVWNRMCQLLVDYEILDHNPMLQVPKGKLDKNPIPKELPADAVESLLATLASEDDPDPKRRPHPRRWRERDYAMVATNLATAARASEICGLNFGDVTSTYSDAQARHLTIRGKGSVKRRLAIEAPVVKVIEDYLHTRLKREGDNSSTGHEDDIWSMWSPDQPLFIQAGGTRATPGMFYRRLAAYYDEAGISKHRAPGALPHQLRHTVATMLANDPRVTPHDLRSFLGHSSLSATERYTQGAGKETRATGLRNPVYKLVGGEED